MRRWSSSLSITAKVWAPLRIRAPWAEAIRSVLQRWFSTREARSRGASSAMGKKVYPSSTGNRGRTCSKTALACSSLWLLTKGRSLKFRARRTRQLRIICVRGMLVMLSPPYPESDPVAGQPVRNPRFQWPPVKLPGAYPVRFGQAHHRLAGCPCVGCVRPGCPQ